MEPVPPPQDKPATPQPPQSNRGPGEERAGYLVTRLVAGEGLVIEGRSEIRVGQCRGGQVSLAIRAARDVRIRRVR